MKAVRSSREAKPSAIGGHPRVLAEDDRRLGLVAADLVDRQPVYLVREDQPAVGLVDVEMGGEVGDVAPRLVPDGRDADVARHVVAAARLQLGEEGADAAARIEHVVDERSEEHTSELQSLMRNSYAVFCLKKKQTKTQHNT